MAGTNEAYVPSYLFIRRAFLWVPAAGMLDLNQLSRGGSVFAPAAARAYTVEGEGVVYRAATLFPGA